MKNCRNIPEEAFFDQPVPEPSALGLATLGALLLGWRGYRHRYRSNRE